MGGNAELILLFQSALDEVIRRDNERLERRKQAFIHQLEAGKVFHPGGAVCPRG